MTLRSAADMTRIRSSLGSSGRTPGQSSVRHVDQNLHLLLFQIFRKFQTRKILRGDSVGDVSAADIRESRTNDRV